jgi:hypothetical protein
MLPFTMRRIVDVSARNAWRAVRRDTLASRPTKRAATAAAASAATDGARGTGAFAGFTRSTQVRSSSRSTSIWRAVWGPSRWKGLLCTAILQRPNLLDQQACNAVIYLQCIAAVRQENSQEIAASLAIKAHTICVCIATRTAISGSFVDGSAAGCLRRMHT